MFRTDELSGIPVTNMEAERPLPKLDTARMRKSIPCR
jgi:hypothetical protein